MNAITEEQPTVAESIAGIQNALGAAMYGSEQWAGRQAAVAAQSAVQAARADRQAARDEAIARLHLTQQWAITIMVVILTSVISALVVSGAVYLAVSVP